ncbi:hypothetical protein FOZ62_025350 [Perkinsus olseni]|uniref:Uncharacterized protein n=1 Tax=Perkinsus olseni TaxID=32597 RepID=A0A7J6TEJ6_PEROL|nr:hypothetical protein FOZ62_025350 [Perkinsus olseni]
MADSESSGTRSAEVSLPLYITALSLTASIVVFGVNVGISKILYITDEHSAKVGVWNFPTCLCLDLTITTVVFSVLIWTIVSAFVEMNLRTKWPFIVEKVALPQILSSYLPAVLRHSSVLEVREKGRTCCSRMSFEGTMQTLARGSWIAMISWAFLTMPTCSFITAYDGGRHNEGLGYSSWTLTWIRTTFIAIQTLLLSQVCALTTYIYHTHTTEDPYSRSRYPSFVSTISTTDKTLSPSIARSDSKDTTGLGGPSPRPLEGIPEEEISSDVDGEHEL